MKPTAVYTPDSPLRRPLQFLQDLCYDLWDGRHLAWRLFVRDLKAQYRQSLLGYFWAFAPLVFSALTFIVLQGSNVIHVQTDIPYPLYVFIGTLLWQTFVDAITVPLRVVAVNKNILIKFHFPREALLLSALGEMFFNTLIRLLLLFIVMLWFRAGFHVSQLMLPLALFGLVSFGMACSLFCMPFALLYGDVHRALTILLGFLFLLAPIAYPYPKAGIGFYIAKCNLAVPLIRDGRDWLCGLTHISMGTLSILPLSVVGLFLGFVLYRVTLPHIIGRMGS